MEQLQKFFTEDISSTVLIIINVVAYILYFLVSLKGNKRNRTFTTLFRENNQQIEYNTGSIRKQISELQVENEELKNKLVRLEDALLIILGGDKNDTTEI